MICGDLGKDLTNGPLAPWNGDRPGAIPSCEPVEMHVPRKALERPRPSTSNSIHVDNTGQMFQNASFLAEIPQRSGIEEHDIRDALHNIFAFAAAAECSFLTMMQGLVDREVLLQSSGKQTEWTLSNLRYFKSAIDDHISNIENMQAFLERSDIQRWSPHKSTPKSPLRSGSSSSPLHVPPPQISTGNVLNSSEYGLPALRDDYSYLLQRAKKLSTLCVENSTILMNMAMLEESKKAITQADGLRRLTLLTFFFLPLSLTTGFFGMNFKEFGNGTLSIWSCFVFAVPLVSISITLCFWDSIWPWLRQKPGLSWHQAV